MSCTDAISRRPEAARSPARLQRFAARVHDFKITHDAGAVAFGREVRGAAGVGDGALLGFGLSMRWRMPDRLFHVAEGHQHPLAIIRNASWCAARSAGGSRGCVRREDRSDRLGPIDTCGCPI